MEWLGFLYALALGLSYLIGVWTEANRWKNYDERLEDIEIRCNQLAKELQRVERDLIKHENKIISLFERNSDVFKAYYRLEKLVDELFRDVSELRGKIREIKQKATA
ncbi:MAG: hypothetical protein GSR81_02805 [Desulfurococcales archaeon]|nr:hypothetical protein [Desulfurococcales archaeon]